MANGDAGDPWHLLHLLLLPLGAVMGWLIKQLGLKADKEEVRRSLAALNEQLAEMRIERREMHRENSLKLDALNSTMLNIVGGIFNRRDL